MSWKLRAKLYLIISGKSCPGKFVLVHLIILSNLLQVAGKALPKEGLDREVAEKAVMELKQISLQACAPLSLR